MMTALLLFASQTIMVTLLVIQSVNNNHGRTFWAAVTSLGIGVASIAQWKLMPGADGMQMAAFLLAGPVGNVLAQWIKRHDIARVKALREPVLQLPLASLNAEIGEAAMRERLRRANDRAG
jgi:hypothetical protein